MKLTEKAKAERQLKKALAALDTAVQNWYEVNAPDNTDRYASCHIRDYPYDPDLIHVSDLTLCIGPDKFVDIRSSKDRSKC